MPYLKKVSITATRTSAAALSTNFNGWINGQIHSIVQRPGSSGTKVAVVTIGRGSSADVVLKYAGTTSLLKFYPRAAFCNSTGNSSSLRALVPFTTQEITVNIPAASSEDQTKTRLDVYYLPGN